MLYFLLAGSVVSSAVYSTMNSLFSKRRMKSNTDFYLYNAIVSGTAAVLFLILSRGVREISIYTLLVGLIFTAIMLAVQYTNMKALQCGPLSYTVMFSSCGMILSVSAGVLFWQERFVGLQVLGTGILVVSFMVGANFKKHQNITLKWLWYALALFLFSGLVGIVQKIHQSSPHRGELFSLLWIVFTATSVVSFFLYKLTKQKTKRKTFTLTGKNLMQCVLTGLFTALTHAANLYLSGMMSSMFFFPVFNGSFTVLCGVISYFFLKEKLNISQRISFTLGIVGLICLGVG